MVTKSFQRHRTILRSRKTYDIGQFLRRIRSGRTNAKREPKTRVTRFTVDESFSSTRHIIIIPAGCISLAPFHSRFLTHALKLHVYTHVRRSRCIYRRRRPHQPRRTCGPARTFSIRDHYTYLHNIIYIYDI